jgi:hypothetical protein
MFGPNVAAVAVGFPFGGTVKKLADKSIEGLATIAAARLAALRVDVIEAWALPMANRDSDEAETITPAKRRL